MSNSQPIKGLVGLQRWMDGRHPESSDIQLKDRMGRHVNQVTHPEVKPVRAELNIDIEEDRQPERRHVPLTGFAWEEIKRPDPLQAHLEERGDRIRQATQHLRHLSIPTPLINDTAIPEAQNQNLFPTEEVLLYSNQYPDESVETGTAEQVSGGIRMNDASKDLSDNTLVALVNPGSLQDSLPLSHSYQLSFAPTQNIA